MYIQGRRGVLVKFRGGELLLLLFFCCAGPLFAHPTFEDALDRVVTEVVRERIGEVEVSAVRTPLRRGGSIEVHTWGNRAIELPFEDTWVFMVDDAPLANWAHPCRYVFVAKDLSEVIVQRARTPLHVRRFPTRRDGVETADEALEVVVPYDYEAAVTPEKKRRDPPPATCSIRYEGSASNCYAVIISGGANKKNNHIRYWGDSAFIYSTLTLKYNYPKENIFVLISDGLDPAPDRSDDTNSPFDLDGDGLDDTMYPATREAISNVFVHLQGQLTTNDQLFVFLTDHGSPTKGAGPRDVELNLWNLEVLRDYELRELTEPIAAPIIFAMEQCHSGGFIYDLDQPDRAVATAAYYDESSWAGNTFPYFNQWAYYWTAAMRGFFPKSFEEPWEDGDPADADYNGDGFVSFAEAYRFAFENKFMLDNPMYNENPSGMGKRMFLTKPDREQVGMGTFFLDPVGPIHYTADPLDLRAVAANVFGDVMTSYTGELTVRAEARPIDPGHYVGDGDERWTFPVHTDYMDARTQVIYPAELIGEARTLDHLSLDLVSLPAGFVNHWTIRMKHTPLERYSEGAGWEADGWTTVHQSDVTEAETGWITFMFDQPFEFNGTDNLMVDFSFFNTNYTISGKSHATEGSEFVSMVLASDNEYDDPLDWAGSEPTNYLSRLRPNLRFGPPPVPVEVRVTPANLTGFASGSATGSVWVLDPAAAMRILVQDAAHPEWSAATEWFEMRASCGTLADAMQAPELAWTTGGDADWFAQDTVAREGGFPCAAQSGLIADHEETWLETTLSGPGVASFWWKTSCEENYDWLRFYVDGVERAALSGETGWEHVSVPIAYEADHTLRWVYSKDKNMAEGADCGWVGEFEWSPGSPYSFEQWAAQHGFSGDVHAIFKQVTHAQGFANGFIYAVGTNMPADQVLLRIRLLTDGDWVVETPQQDASTVPYAGLELIGSTNKVDWGLPLIPAHDETGKPTGSSWHVPADPALERGYFRLRGYLKE